MIYIRRYSKCVLVVHQYHRLIRCLAIADRSLQSLNDPRVVGSRVDFCGRQIAEGGQQVGQVEKEGGGGLGGVG